MQDADGNVDDGDGDPHEAISRLVKILIKDVEQGVEAVLSVAIGAEGWDQITSMLDQMDDGLDRDGI